MFFLSMLAFAAGYLLNEESSLTRICKKRALLPIGWFVLKEPSSLWILSLSGVLAFLKGYAWAILLLNLKTDYGFILGGVYLAGNITAAKQAKGLLFTPVLGALGFALAMHEPVFQATFTSCVVGWLVKRDISQVLVLSRVVFCVSFIIFAGFSEFLFWTVFVIIACLICNEESPFHTRLIKYFDRIMRWRVTI